MPETNDFESAIDSPYSNILDEFESGNYASFFDSFDVYGREGSVMEGKTAEELFDVIRANVAPEYSMAAIDRLAQLYLNSIIEPKEANRVVIDTGFYGPLNLMIPNYAKWQAEKGALNALMEAGKMSVGRYYDNKLQEDNLGEIMDLLLPHEREIIESCGDAKAKKYQLSEKYENIGDFKNILEEELEGSEKPDCIVYVATGAFTPAALVAGRLNVPLIPVRYSRCACKDTEAKTPFNMPYSELLQQFYGKNVLVVEDSSIYGESLANVMKYVAGCGAKTVRGTAVECVEKMQADLKNGIKIDPLIDTLSAGNGSYLFEYLNSAEIPAIVPSNVFVVQLLESPAALDGSDSTHPVTAYEPVKPYGAIAFSERAMIEANE